MGSGRNIDMADSIIYLAIVGSKVNFGLAGGKKRRVFWIRSEKQKKSPYGCGRRGHGDETIPDHRFILPLVH